MPKSLVDEAPVDGTLVGVLMMAGALSVEALVGEAPGDGSLVDGALVNWALLAGDLLDGALVAGDLADGALAEEELCLTLTYNASTISCTSVASSSDPMFLYRAAHLPASIRIFFDIAPEFWCFMRRGWPSLEMIFTRRCLKSAGEGRDG